MAQQPVKLNPYLKDSPRRFSFGRTLILVLLFAWGFSILHACNSRPEPVPQPTATATPEVRLYQDCKDVWEKLNRPIFAEDEGYRGSFDWDGDGIGCEDNPATEEDEAEINWAALRDQFRDRLEELGDWVAPHLENLVDKGKSIIDKALDIFSR